MNTREHCKLIFEAAVAAVHPGRLIPAFMDLHSDVLRIGEKNIQLSASTNIFITGAGKASAAMALAVEKITGNRIKEGFIVTKYDHELPLQYIEYQEAGHPVPDQNGVTAVEKTIRLVKKAGANDIIICLLSGGASALWADVPASISLEAVQKTNSILLKSGAGIAEINTVRKHLSRIKGGQLLTYAPLSKWYSLLISDVPGDVLSDIASGPTTADSSSFADVKDIIEKYQLSSRLPAEILQHIENGLCNRVPETIKPGHPVVKNCKNLLIGTNRRALDAARREAQKMGYHTIIPESCMQGNTTEAARNLFELYAGYQGQKPVCFLTGGETTVQITGKGKGGRNQHLALQMLEQINLNEIPGLCFLAAGTDGTDGPTDAAGAFADQSTLLRMKENGMSLTSYLQQQDSYHFFKETGALFNTGSTGTNVMDLSIAILR